MLLNTCLSVKMTELSEFEDKNLLEMLEFENQLFLDILNQDALVVTAK